MDSSIKFPITAISGRRTSVRARWAIAGDRANQCFPKTKKPNLPFILAAAFMRRCNRFPVFRINGKSPAILGRAQFSQTHVWLHQ
jgi:hypothetical protein